MAKQKYPKTIYVVGDSEARALLDHPRIALAGSDDLIAYYPLNGDRAASVS